MTGQQCKLQFLIDFWQESATREGWVEKKHITLSDLSIVASNLILLKLTENDHWKFTLVGTDIVQEYKQDFTGTYIDDIPYEECRTLYREATSRTSSTLLAHRIEGNFCSYDGSYLKAKEVAIPVSENGENITHVLIVCLIDRSDPKRHLYDEIGHDTFDYSILPLKSVSFK